MTKVKAFQIVELRQVRRLEVETRKSTVVSIRAASQTDRRPRPVTGWTVLREIGNVLNDVLPCLKKSADPQPRHLLSRHS